MAAILPTFAFSEVVACPEAVGEQVEGQTFTVGVQQCGPGAYGGHGPVQVRLDPPLAPFGFRVICPLP